MIAEVGNQKRGTIHLDECYDSERLQITCERVKLLLTKEVGIRKISAKLMPRILTDEQA